MRDAVIDDLPLLDHIARDAKRHWGYPDEWIQAWSGALTVRPEDLIRQRVLVAELDGRSVGFCAIMPKSTSWSLEHMWVLPEFMGLGVGVALLDAAVSHVKDKGGKTMIIESDPNAEGFYLRMGANRVGQIAAPVAGTERYLPVLELPVR